VIGLYDALGRPLLGLLEAETAHHLAIKALKLAPLPSRNENDALLALERHAVSQVIALWPGIRCLVVLARVRIRRE